MEGQTYSVAREEKYGKNQGCYCWNMLMQKNEDHSLESGALIRARIINRISY